MREKTMVAHIKVPNCLKKVRAVGSKKTEAPNEVTAPETIETATSVASRMKVGVNELELRSEERGLRI